MTALGFAPSDRELDVLVQEAAVALTREVGRAWLDHEVAASFLAADGLEQGDRPASGAATVANAAQNQRDDSSGVMVKSNPLSSEQRLEAEAAQWFARLRGFESVEEALRAYADHRTGALTAPSISSCIEELAEEKRASCRLPDTTRSFKVNLAAFSERFGERRPKDVAAAEITDLLQRWENPRASQWRARKISEFYEWAVRRKYALDNPVSLELRRPKLPFVRKVIFTPRQARFILKHTRHTDQIGFWVLSFFAGMRTQEIIRFHAHPAPWSLVRWRSGIIKLPGEITGRMTRTVKVRPLLRLWLKWVKARRAPFFPANAWYKIPPVWRQAIHRNPDNRTRRLREQKQPSRHESFAIARNTHLAYRLRLPKASLEELAWDTGDTVKLLRAHINPGISPRRAWDFFALAPASLGADVPPDRRPGRSRRKVPAALENSP